MFALAAAVLHALWNLLLARAPDVEAATAVALLTAEVVFAPVAIVVWHVNAGVWPWLLASGLLQLIYFALLATAYWRAPLSVVYPIARGGAPVVVLAVSVLALGHSTSARQIAGGCPDRASGSSSFVAYGRLRCRRARLRAAIACCIGAYTLIDKHGIAYAARSRISRCRCCCRRSRTPRVSRA